MHWILIILKIIGILIGVLFGILTALILVILFLPIHYEIYAEKNELEDLMKENNNGIYGRVNITWLLRILTGRVVYENGETSFSIYIFGFPLKSKDKKQEEEFSQKKKRKERKKQQKDRKKEKDKKAETKILEPREEKPILEPKKLETKKEEKIDQTKDNQSLENLFNIEEKNREEKSEEKKGNKSKTKKRKVKKSSPIQRIRKFFQKIGDTIKNTVAKLRKIGENISIIPNKIQKVILFLKDEPNKAAFGSIWNHIRKVLLHLKPTKIKGQIFFGMGDPCMTGRVLGILGILFSYYGKSVKIVPEFERMVLEVQMKIKGRIRLATLLLIALRLYKEKGIKDLWQRFNQLKEEL